MEELEKLKAQLEIYQRRITENMQRARRAKAKLQKFRDSTERANAMVQPALDAVEMNQPWRVDKILKEIEEHFEISAKRWFEIVGVLSDPNVGAVEAADLGFRTLPSGSVIFRHPSADGKPGRVSVRFDHIDRNRGSYHQLKGQKDHQPTYLELFSGMARKLTPAELLEAVPPDMAKQLFVKMVEDAVNNFTATKAKMVMSTLSEFMKFVEPKVVLQTETPVEQMTEEETMEFLLGAQRVMEQKLAQEE